MRNVLRRWAPVAALVPLLVLGAGCGGGGGGGGGDPPALPGTLSALAVQGSPTPEGGVYGGFAANTLMATADGGWTAFVADVVGGSTAKALFVARPNGAIVTVFKKGDLIPTTNGASGQLDDFERIWMRPGGIVVAHVSNSSGAAEAFVSAVVDGSGSVTTKATAAYLGVSLPNAPGMTTLTAIDQDITQVDDQGSIFFHGTGTGVTPVHAILAVARGGPPINPVVKSGDTLPANFPTAGTFGFDFQSIGIDRDGTLVAFEADVAGSPSRAIFANLQGAGTTYVAGNGGGVANPVGRTFENVHDSGPLHVSLGGGVGYVTWRADLNGAAPDKGVYTRLVVNGGVLSTSSLVQSLLAPTEPISGVGGGSLAAADVFPQENSPGFVVLESSITGSTTGVDVVYVRSAGPGVFEEILRNGALAPGGSTFLTQTSFPSLHVSDTVADANGSLAFTAVLADASTGVFWDIRGSDFFVVVKQGEAAPGTGGGTFGAFTSPSGLSTATNLLVFRATVVGGTGATGIFRRG